MKKLNKVTVLAPAKINLFLHVIGKTKNNYHLLQSLVYFADYGDEITIAESNKFSFENAGLKIPEQNSVIQAAEKLSKTLKKPLNCKITLSKNIPIGAGLGGGSSNAAATVKALLKFWKADINQKILKFILTSLGADVPSCYTMKPCYFEGIGEKITTIINPPELYAILVNPNKQTSTQDVFDNYKSVYTDPIILPQKFSTKYDIVHFLSNTRNDLTKSACQITPDIQNILEILNQRENMRMSRMSGSGSTCFSLFDSIEEAENTAIKLKEQYPEWWIKSVTLN